MPQVPDPLYRGDDALSVAAGGNALPRHPSLIEAQAALRQQYPPGQALPQTDMGYQDHRPPSATEDYGENGRLSRLHGLHAEEAAALAFLTATNPVLGTMAMSHYGLGRMIPASGPCPTPPQSPPNADLDRNIDIAKDYSWLNPGADLAFVNLVRNHKPWDYKRQDSKKYENFGNFNFGATAAAMGFPYEVAQNGAGIYQRFWGAATAGAGTPVLNWPYGDAKNDAEQIKDGYDYYNKNCSAKK